MAKKRLDVLVTERGLAASRERAKRLIMEGKVFVDGQREDKPGMTFAEDCELTLKGEDMPYVSRGGYKLEKAMKTFPIELTGDVCMDIGASTGGFTDCMLQNGAAKVYSVDVGYGQFAWSLRTDPRVVCMEKTNVRYLTESQVPESLDFASCDVSFISLSKVLPAAYNLLKTGGQMVCLIKPQFEAGKDKVGKKGVVREPSVHREVIAKVVSDVKAIGFTPLGLTFSPVKGPEGNIEYLIWLRKDREGKSPLPVPDKDGHVAEDTPDTLSVVSVTDALPEGDALENIIHETVEKAHEELDR
ncbi:MAG: TlyA family RNA methyltransferase [Lachnospiraceae bacterium]|nr:TlyA family RNA methyltransferase [Lachnospiraceae bacterium]